MSADSARGYRENLAEDLKSQVLKEISWYVRFAIKLGKRTDASNIFFLMKFATRNTEWTSF